MTYEHPASRTLASILNDGAYLIVSHLPSQKRVLGKTHTLLRTGVESLRGAAARRSIESRGFGALHEVLPAEQIGALRDFVMAELRPDLLALACEIGRDVLGIDGEFFIDDYTILRINYPYAVAVKAPKTAENPGIGRVSPQTREHTRANKVVDPAYDPKGYHNHEPPPAWAHGPHQDTWTGHSRFGVNLWWAVDDVPEECSMVFYPETFGQTFEPDPRSLYLKAGYPLPKPVKMALRAGEMLIFNPEMLHGTHLNTAAVTRLALSSRLNPRRPKFNPDCFYAREFWHSSANIEAGEFDKVVHLPRAENLDSEARPPMPPQVTQPDVIVAVSDAAPGEWRPICASARVRPGEKALVRLNSERFGGDENVLLLRGDHMLRAVQARCPHLNVSLADGHHTDASIWCPAHAVAFSLEDGRSSCDLLTLPVYDVRESDGTVWLRLVRDAARREPPERANGFAVHRVSGRPRLSVSILTRNSADRLERLIAEASSYADEVIVGVDGASDDGTLEVAAAHADVVYRFSHKGRLAAARMLPFEYASGDWILSLDDDESTEPGFEAILPELVEGRLATHFWFPRKWVVALDEDGGEGCEYVHAQPWFPDWQLRLFRNDRALVWKPPQPHTGYRVQGPGIHESRASILHFEPLLRSREERERKLRQYSALGGKPEAEAQYASLPATSRRRVIARPMSHVAPRRTRERAPQVHRVVHDTGEVRQPWGATIMGVEMSRVASAGELIAATVTAKNVGCVVWAAFYGGRSALIQLGYHLLDREGRLIAWDGPRFPVLGYVKPGDTTQFLCEVESPADAGDYLLEWDLVSEGEIWFADCGSTVLRTPLTVRA